MTTYTVPWPTAKVGSAQVVIVTVTADDSKWDSMRRLFNGTGHRQVRPGTYRQLIVNDTLWMSDTPAEQRDHWQLFRAARTYGGRVLMNGLGLGMALRGVLAEGAVQHVDVTEINPDVVALIGPHFAADPRVTIHTTDAWTHPWPKGMVWDVAWHDIWPNLCTDDLAEHRRMKLKFTRRTRWQQCWGNEELKYQKRREARW